MNQKDAEKIGEGWERLCPRVVSKVPSKLQPAFIYFWTLSVHAVLGRVWFGESSTVRSGVCRERFGPQSCCKVDSQLRVPGWLVRLIKSQRSRESASIQPAISLEGKLLEGSLEVKLPTIWTDEKQRWEESEKRREERRRSRRAKKVGKSGTIVFFQWLVAPEGRKVGSLKRRVRSQLARWEVKKCTPLWREPHFEVEMLKARHVRSTFGGLDVVSRGSRKGLCTLSKVSKTWGFCSISKHDGRHGTFEEDLPRWIFRDRRSTRDMFIRGTRRSGRWFLERGCILECQIFSFGKMILRDRCSTSYDLASLFRGTRNTLDRWSGKSQNALVRGCQLCTQLSIFEGCLAELLRFGCCQLRKVRKSPRLVRFWCCQLRKMRKSRRIASFLMFSEKKELMLPSSKTEEVSQNSFVLKLADRQIDRQTDREIDRLIDWWIDG